MDSSNPQYLAYQQELTFSGTVSYEKGLEIIKSSGYLVINGGFLFVYGDLARLIRDQKRLMIPLERVIDIEADEP